MSSLTSVEKRTLEKLLGMATGYVAGHSGKALAEIIFDDVGIDVKEYEPNPGTSAAQRLRAFWTREPDYVVGKLLRILLEHRRLGRGDLPDFMDEEHHLVDRGDDIAARLMSGGAVQGAESFSTRVGDESVDMLARELQIAIDRNELQAALDRLHTYATHRLRRLVEEKTGCPPSQDKPLHSLMGEYVKALGDEIESEMTELILKSSISVLDRFNDVRNNRSLAHPNELLNYAEALLIFRHVTATLHFIDAQRQRSRAEEGESDESK